MIHLAALSGYPGGAALFFPRRDANVERRR